MTHSTQIISLHSSQGDYTSLLEDLGEGAIRFQNLLIFFWIFDKGFVFKYSYNLCTMCSAHDPNRYPPNGVWGNQRVLGGARKVLEEGGWSFPGLAQAPGSKHFNPLFYFLKRKYPITQWRPILNDSLHQTTYKSEENLRRGRPKLHADLFGIEGSFRKLDIDWSGFYWFSLFAGFSITYLKYDTGSERWLFTTFIMFWLNTRFLKILVFISNFVNHI